MTSNSVMDKATFHKLVAHLIRIRKAKKHIEALNDRVSAVVKTELIRLGVNELETTAGDITLYDATDRHIDPLELHGKIGDDFFDHVEVKKTSLRESYGSEFVDEISEIIQINRRMLVKPANKKDKLTITLKK